MEAIANAAQQDGIAYFALVTACIIIGVLAMLLWYFIRQRMAAKDRAELTLEKRLASGSETMQRLTERIERLHFEQMEQLRNFMTITHFNDYCKEHNKSHVEIETQLEKLLCANMEVKAEMRALFERVETNMATLTNLLTKIVLVKNPVTQ